MASLTTADVFVTGNATVEVPLIKDRHGRYVESACTYLRQYVLGNRGLDSSAGTYAENLVSFLSFLERARVTLEDFTDRHLVAWMQEQADRKLKRNTVEGRLDTVFRFAVWLAGNGQEDIVRLPWASYPPGFRFRLSSRPDTSKRGRSSAGIVSDLQPLGSRSARQPTPTTEDVAKLAAVIAVRPNQQVRERNELLVSWYFEVGLRRNEWRDLTIAQIPEFAAIVKMTVCTEFQELSLEHTKGDRQRWVAVLPNLLERTREYIEGARSAVVERFKDAYGSSGAPKEVFLSNKTGMPMAPRAISNLCTALFLEAGIEGHGHRIRATHLTNLFDEEYEAQLALRRSLDGKYRMGIDFELILRRVAERAGHKDLESLRHYIVILKKRYLRDVGVDEAVALAQLIAGRQVELAALDARVTKAKSQLTTAPGVTELAG